MSGGCQTLIAFIRGFFVVPFNIILHVFLCFFFDLRMRVVEEYKERLHGIIKYRT